MRFTRSISIKALISSTLLGLSLAMSLLPQASIAASNKRHYKYSHSYVVRHHRYFVLTKEAAKRYNVRGVASWYGKDFHGKKTALGTTYNMFAMTAASKVLPLGSHVRVTNLKNNKSVVLKINDRGPFIGRRIIDLSYAAAKRLGYSHSGIAKVRVTVV